MTRLFIHHFRVVGMTYLDTNKFSMYSVLFHFSNAVHAWISEICIYLPRTW